jgi:hydrogenase-4 component B
VWTGGVPAERGDPRIHPLGFYSPLREALRRAYAAPRAPRLGRPEWVLPVADLDHWLYAPAAAAGRRLVWGLRRLHTGVPNVYLAWQLVGATAVACLVLWLALR